MKRTIPSLYIERDKLIEWLAANVSSPDFFKKNQILGQITFEIQKLEAPKPTNIAIKQLVAYGKHSIIT